MHSLVGLDYGNGDKVEYTYDKQGRVTTQNYTYVYNGNSLRYLDCITPKGVSSHDHYFYPR